MSKIKVIILDEETESFELHAGCLKEVLSLLQLQKGEEFVTSLGRENYKYILADSSNYENMIALTPEVIFSEFTGYDSLFITKDIEGEEPASFGIALATFLGEGAGTAATLTTLGSIIAYTATFVALVAVSMAVSAVMSALSPTSEFSKDPSKQQESNLFNSAPIVRNQGGSVPLIFGNPYCGAVLISSGLTTEEVKV